MRAFGGTGMNAPDEDGEDHNTDKETDREDEGGFEMLRQKGDSVVFWDATIIHKNENIIERCKVHLR